MMNYLISLLLSTCSMQPGSDAYVKIEVLDESQESAFISPGEIGFYAQQRLSEILLYCFSRIESEALLKEDLSIDRDPFLLVKYVKDFRYKVSEEEQTRAVIEALIAKFNLNVTSDAVVIDEVVINRADSNNDCVSYRTPMDGTSYVKDGFLVVDGIETTDLFGYIRAAHGIWVRLNLEPNSEFNKLYLTLNIPNSALQSAGAFEKFLDAHGLEVSQEKRIVHRLEISDDG